MQEMNSWGVTKGGNTNNGFCKIFPIAARIGWPADDLVAKFKVAILHQWRPSNLTVLQGGGGIQTCVSIEAINSMPLQHEASVLRIFPDWSHAMDASFTRLRAKGAFLVSSEQRAGDISFVDIIGEKGGDLHIANPWASRKVAVTTYGKPTQRVSADDSGQLLLQTTASLHYHLAPR
jgi:alpha-L-fucosidase 2